MTVHSLYVFSRRGTCVYYREWNRPRSTLSDTPSEDRKLMFGLYFSLKQLAQKMAPNPDAPGGLKRVLSSAYAIHSYESPTGYKVLLTTSRDVTDLRATLGKLYTDLFLPFVLFNPLYTLGQDITCPLFVSGVETFVRSLPCF